jgi:hypothetical protein
VTVTVLVGAYDVSDLRFSASQPRDENGKWTSGSNTTPSGVNGYVDKGLPGGVWVEAAAPGEGVSGVRLTRIVSAKLGNPNLGGEEAAVLYADGFGDDARGAAKAMAAKGVASRMTSSTDDMLAEALDGRDPVIDDYTNQPMPPDEATAIKAQPDRTPAENTYVVATLGSGELDIQEMQNVVDVQTVLRKTNPVRGDVMAMADEDGRLSPTSGDETVWAVTGTRAADRMARESMASNLIDRWAGSSNVHPRSLAIQRAAEDEFALKGSAKWERDGDDEGGSAAAASASLYRKHGGVYRDFVRAQYEGTQETLSAAGVKTLTVHRGVKDPSNRMNLPTGDDITVQIRPLSSWSGALEVAQDFSVSYHPSDTGSRIMTATVPRARVLSIGTDGVGCLNENEVVVLGPSVSHVRSEAAQ